MMGFTDNYRKQVKFFTNTLMTLQSKNMFLVQCIQYIRQNVQLGPKLRPHVGLSNITTASECLNIIQAQPFVSDLHC